MRYPTHSTDNPRGRMRRGDFPTGPSGEGFDPRRGAFYPHGEHGGGPRGPRGFGGPGFGGPGFGGRGPGRRAGRGDIRAAILLLLNEQPMHGYQLIQEIGQRSGGQWRPSPGAIYPALNLLEDEGLVAITAESGRKMARLTEAGTTYVTENAEQLGQPVRGRREPAHLAGSQPARCGRGARRRGSPGRSVRHRRAGHPGARGPRALAPGPLPDPRGRRGRGNRPGRLTLHHPQRHPATSVRGAVVVPDPSCGARSALCTADLASTGGCRRTQTSAEIARDRAERACVTFQA